MATATLTLDKATYNKGETVTATYAVAGADPLTFTVTGDVHVDGVAVPATAQITIGHKVTFGAPTGTGLAFNATPDPKVWVATA